jgi:LytS/YehU family sensor histidine kinase
MVAAIAYATQAAARGARIEADAARAQLAALRAQLHPHFLFNALHAVVQLIPVDPRRAVQAAEQLADLLRTSLEEQRDRVTLAEEWSFVERYLAIEYLRFGERLACTIEINPETRAAQLPSFALQTLVENAVRHGASPRVEPTQVTISAGMTGSLLTLVVHDDGQAADLEKIATSAGTGLRRLRDRLERLYGVRARLDLAKDSGGFSATLIVPQEETGDDD